MIINEEASPELPGDTARGYHMSWFPLALASEVTAGQIIGRAFLGTRVVIYRDAAGRAIVQGAYCPHLGADLSVGDLVDGQLRCAYHHWQFNCAGTCVDIPAGDKIPPGARIPTYPSAEAWGLIWAFNGQAAAFPAPTIPGADESELAYRAHYRGTRAVDPWVAVSNGVDFQHLHTLHGLPGNAADTLRVGPHAIEYEIVAPRSTHRGRITGVNTFSQQLILDGREVFMLFSGAPITHGLSTGFYVYGVRKDAAAPAELSARLDAVQAFAERLLAEDAPVLDTIRFRPRILTASDRHLARFFKYVRHFARAVPPAS